MARGARGSRNPRRRGALVIALAIALLAPGRVPAQDPAPPRRPAPAARPASAEPAEPEPPPSETAWIRGELKMNFRAAPTPTATPLGIVTTGDQVVVLERRGGWARVRVASGEAGWVPESVLVAEAPPFERVRQLETELGTVREELAVAQREIEKLQHRDEEREARAKQREEAFQQIEEENRDLRAGERWPYMVTGASILGAGLTAGFLMRGGASRRGGGGRIRF